MNDRASLLPPSNVIWPGIIVAALGLYTYLTYQPALKSARPTPLDQTEYPVVTQGEVSRVYARLWQDPLGKEYVKLQSDTSSSKEGRPHALRKSDFLSDDALSHAYLVMPVFLPGGPTVDDREQRRRTRYAVIAALTTLGFRPESTSRLRYFSTESLELPWKTDGSDSACSPTSCAKTGERQTQGGGFTIPYETFVAGATDTLYASNPGELRDKKNDGQGDAKSSSKPGDTKNDTKDGTKDGTTNGTKNGTKSERPYEDGFLYKSVLVLWLNEDDTQEEGHLRTVANVVQGLQQLFSQDQRGRMTQSLGSMGLQDKVKRIFRMIATRVNSTLRLYGTGGRSTSQDDAYAWSETRNAIKRFFADVYFVVRQKSNMSVRIIGPSSTDTLLSMAYEYDLAMHRATPDTSRPYSWSSWNEVWRMYSPRSTISVDFLRGKSEGDQRLRIECAADLLAQFLEGTGETKASQVARPPFDIDVIRTAGTDEQLVESLQHELELRDAWPNAHDDGECIVLITERDTIYGRAMPYIFRKMVEVTIMEQDCEDDAETADDDAGSTKDEVRQRRGMQLLEFTYLRGLDGVLPTDRNNGTRESEDRADRRQNQQPVKSTGRSQLDYLARLEEKLVEIHQARRRVGGRGIVAVGVTGSDIYDKMVILRSLRSQFPNACFFTTDLDEELCRRSEFEHTRNMLVASHFGLSLYPYLQRGVPPFRDSYQTACFLSALFALGDERLEWVCGRNDGSLWDYYPIVVREDAVVDKEEHDKKCDPASHLSPLIFEIGRRGPYQLTKTGGTFVTSPAVEPSRSCIERNGIRAGIHETSPRERGVLSWPSWRMWLSIFVTVIFLTIVLAYYLTTLRQMLLATVEAIGKGTTGIVLFPSCFILLGGKLVWLQARRSGIRRAFAGLVGTGRAAAEISRESLKRRGLLKGLQIIVTVITLIFATLIGMIVASHSMESHEPFALFAGVSIWPSTIIRFLAAVLAVVFILKALRDLGGHPDGLCGAGVTAGRARHATLTASRRARLKPLGRFTSALRDVFQWEVRRPASLRRGRAVNVGVLCDRHAHKGQASFRIIRSLTVSVCFIAFALGLFCLFGFPNSPYRGWIARYVGFVVLLVSVFALVLLSFFVIDAIQLCRRFIVSLGCESREWPRASMREALGRWSLDYPCELRELLIVRVVASYTNSVSKLLLFPFTIFLLMIIARHSAFDCWDISLSLVVVMTLILFGLVSQALLMRRDARKARDAAISRLRQRMIAAESLGFGDRKEMLVKLIAEIDRTQHGAFRRITDDYVFRALAIPFGGASGLLLLDQLLY